MLHVGNAGHGNFKRHSDLLLNFFSGAAGPLRNDLDIVIGYVGIGFDRQVVEGDDAPGEEDDGHCQDNETVVQRKIYQTTDHLLFHRVLQLKRIADYLLACGKPTYNLDHAVGQCIAGLYGKPAKLTPALTIASAGIVWQVDPRAIV